jgi:hypothetical protein
MQSKVIYSGYPDPSAAINQTYHSNFQQISIGPDWAAALDVSLGVGLPTALVARYDTFIRAVSQSLESADMLNITMSLSLTELWNGLHSTLLSLYFADALARVSLQHKQYARVYSKSPFYLDLQAPTFSQHEPSNVSAFDQLAAQGNWTKFNVTFSRYGYGWSSSGILVRIAFAILFLHAVATIIHIIAVAKKRRMCVAWGSLGELVALAMNSSPTCRLRNTCAGISTRKTWQEDVKVINTGDDHLELVFKDDALNIPPHPSRPLPNVEYGARPRGR